mgnify:CR=1 FL=1
MSVAEQTVGLELADSSINTVDQLVRLGLKNLKASSTVDDKWQTKNRA